MKIKIVRSKFLEGLKKVQNIVASKGTLQIIQNVLIEAKDKQLFLTTTDLDVSIRSVVPCEVMAEGATTLPVKILVSAISAVAEGPVELETDAEDKAIVSAGSAVFNIAGMNVADFPQLPQSSDSYPYNLCQNTLRDMLRKTAYSTSQDDTRKTLRGVLMRFRNGKLTMVATDGRRLALVESEVEFPADAERDIILPAKVVAELQRSLSTDESRNARITVERSQVAFDLDDTQIYSKLLDDVYPNYEQVIPTGCTERVTVERRLLLDALERVSVMNMNESNSTRLTFESNRLTVASAAAEVGAARDTLPIKYDGEKIEIVFNPQYVMDPLKAMDEDEINIDLKNGSSPALMKSYPFLYVMMPLRIG